MMIRHSGIFSMEMTDIVVDETKNNNTKNGIYEKDLQLQLTVVVVVVVTYSS